MFLKENAVKIESAFQHHARCRR